ncbi:MAG: TetR family transcriptional regulator C-terminal domain-containing protein [Deltaproteobacteria bacterium]
MSSMNPTHGEIPRAEAGRAPRRPRADGLASRRAILNAAARLATTRGLEGLSIGELAQHIGMSKSGLYAHFKSKEELELATIDTAAEIFENDVIRRVPESPGGLARIRALTEVFLQHLARRVFPGGCFFATVAAQLAAHPGRPRDRVVQLHQEWAAQFIGALRQARDAGELPRDADLDQLVFEITAMMFRANFAWTMTEDERVLGQARTGVLHVLERAARGTRKSTRGRRNGRS